LRRFFSFFKKNLKVKKYLQAEPSRKTKMLRTQTDLTPRFSSRKLECLFATAGLLAHQFRFSFPFRFAEQWIEANLARNNLLQTWLTAAGTAHDLHVIPF